MELCLNVLMGLGIFWVGITAYCACIGCRFGFDIDNPKQLRKLILKPIAKAIMFGGILIIMYSLWKAGLNFFDLPLAVPFTFVAGLVFLGGLALGIWDTRKTDGFFKAVQKIMAYPICFTFFFSFFYFTGICIFLFFNK
jgi:hypothetical protein